MKVKTISAIITLLILIPIIWCGGIVYNIAVAILGILAYKEILDLKKTHKKVPKVASVCGLIAMIYLILGSYGSNILTFRAVLIPIILLLAPTIFYKKDVYSSETAFNLLGLILLVGIGFYIFIIIRDISLNLLIYLMSIAIITDTFACEVGCLIGKHKMCPKISPKKSWEGAIAGLIGGTAIPVIIYSTLVGNFSFKIIIITMILSISGECGDLIFSKIKRENDIKDFSNLIPGHGGILDRFDSMIIIVIMYAILVWSI